ncbi:MAG: tRNA (N6-isopentenyl adenosine(37)-C2)-methylthiotransferase MiaB [Candidatus Cloacimonetes bacterium]|nr:tRNA (N6-isopentenyl adenosine(37)-C2)-methylthiotransferase MiaB [Candidatus Cloacimonadota bacterium]
MQREKFSIITYGCQMNVADSEVVVRILTKAGYEFTENLNDSDIIIFNSCTVRQHAEDRVVGRITQEGSRKKAKHNLLIGLIGCVAQRIGNELLNKIDSLDFVAGTDQYRNLPEIIEFAKLKNISNLQENYNENYEDIYPLRKKNVNAFVTIMRGCNNFCSYCIVPYVRGKERSRNFKAILSEVEKAGKNGFKDITLLGQNVNSYNFGKCNFAELLKKISKLSSIERIRFVTSHPKDLSDEVINVMANEEKICEHIHLPMQSGSDKILQSMNRKYTKTHYLKLVDKLRNSIPDIAITTDVMCGFPDETEKDFLETYDLMKKIKFDYTFTFKYSPRNGTAAEKFDNQIDEKIRLERLQKLINLQEKITLQKYKEQIGKSVKVYVENISKKDENEVSGRTCDNKIVVFSADKNLIGKFVKVKIYDAIGWTLKGKIYKR